MNLPNKKVLFGVLAMALAAPLSTASAFTPQSAQDQEQDFTYLPATGLVAAVRRATAKYQDVNEAVHDGYGPVLGCVSGADEGAMGVHYLNPALVGPLNNPPQHSVIDVAHPQLLVYEPLSNGKLQLVAVEYLAIADGPDGWDANRVGPPTLMGQLFDYMDAPNRFGQPAFYSLHVWAWKFNPEGVFSMWNPRVSCTDYSES